MSESEDEEEAEEDIGGSAVKRVLRRSLNMRRGRTETKKLRRSPQGWSERGQTLVDRFDELIVIYDRICLLIDPVADEDDAEGLVGQYDNLVDGIDRITAIQIDKNPKARDQKIELIGYYIKMAEQIERDLEDYDVDSSNPTPLGLKTLLTSGSPTAQRLLAKEQHGRLAALVDKLPLTQATVTALEEAEDLILAQPPGYVLKELHEVFYRKKTDALEQVVGDKVEDSDNPKLDGLKGLPQDKYWQMLMDGRHQGGDNKHFFDQSQGYMASMMKGLDKIVSEIDSPMSVDFVKEMHSCATYQVTEQTVDTFFGSNKFQEQGLKKSPNDWGACFDFTDEGMDELREMQTEMNLLVPGYFADDLPDPLTRRNVTKQVPKFKAADSLRGQDPALIQAAVTTLLEHTIEKYEEEIETANEEEDDTEKKDKVIGAIIDCCRRLGQIHPFKDANGRLNMFLLLNKMLLENGMSPTILADQGYMIGKGRDELIDLIKQGQNDVDEMKD